MSVGALGVFSGGVYSGCVLRCVLGVFIGGVYWGCTLGMYTGGVLVVYSGGVYWGVYWGCILGVCTWVYTRGVYRSGNQAENSWLPQTDLSIIDLNQLFH